MKFSVYSSNKVLFGMLCKKLVSVGSQISVGLRPTPFTIDQSGIVYKSPFNKIYISPSALVG